MEEWPKGQTAKINRPRCNALALTSECNTPSYSYVNITAHSSH